MRTEIPLRAVNTLLGKRGLTVGAGVVVALVAAAAAGGFWTLGGAGDGTASAETVAAVTLTPGTATTDLYPGRSGDVALSIANSNTYRAYIGSFMLDTSRGTDGFSISGGQSGCDPSAVSYTTQSNGGAGWFVPAGSTLDLDLTDAVALGTGAASECQGATVIVYLLAAP
jgi:hypothetical protein